MAAPPRTKRKNAPEDPSLPAGLQRAAIVPGLKGASLGEAVSELVPLALHGTGPIIARSQDIAAGIRKRMASSEADVRHGVAFVQAQVEGLSGPRSALGIAPGGLQTETPIEGTIHVLFVHLTPRAPSKDAIPAWARRKLGDERIAYRLCDAPDVESIVRILNMES